ESAISTALDSIATGIGKTTLDGGLKYSSNMGWHKRSQSVLFGRLKGCDLLALVELFNPVEGNTGVLEYGVLDDSTCLWILLEDLRGYENLTFLTFFIGVIATNFSLRLFALGHVSRT
nr:hypothetical protein [Tanacetum cinerariifolium]